MRKLAGKAAWRQSANLLRMLAHPRHRSIIDTLAGGEQTVGHIATTTGLPQAVTSQNLKKLRDHDLLSSRRDANRVYYRVRNSAVLKVLQGLRSSGFIG